MVGSDAGAYESPGDGQRFQHVNPDVVSSDVSAPFNNDAAAKNAVGPADNCHLIWRIREHSVLNPLLIG
jgi:hypothetical protein